MMHSPSRHKENARRNPVLETSGLLAFYEIHLLVLRDGIRCTPFTGMQFPACILEQTVAFQLSASLSAGQPESN